MGCITVLLMKECYKMINLFLKLFHDVKLTLVDKIQSQNDQRKKLFL